ncbi:MAG TPA: phosphate ABC transporter substrate-binding protein PstS [Nitrosopumilaceae archaeon]|nr:phosphate ABC transporter substrate-binding protein PstS [Nitrosopumilaceae archaeon]
MTKKFIIGLALMLVLVLPTTSLSARAESSPQEPGDSDKYAFNAAGATFPFPLIDKWRVEYHNDYPGITLNYQSIGSGGGITLFKKQTVDFAASDAPLQPADIKTAPKNTLHIPETMGAIVLTYNLPEFQKNGLKLTGPVIADIYMGKITTWNNPAIAKLNPGVKLSGNTIVLVHRSDGSGTTFAFTDYLSKVSPEWKSTVGKGTAVPWTAGVGGSGNAGVAAVVKKVPWSLGYVELAYAKNNMLAGTNIPMTYAYIQNHDKTAFLDATVDTTLAAAQGALKNLPASNAAWSNVSINDAPGKNSYPIATFTYLLVNADLDKVKGMDKQKAQDLVHMLYWFVTSGQKYSTKLLYVPLPTGVQELDKDGLSKIKFNGQQLFDNTQ